jgi:hypothetical protein
MVCTYALIHLSVSIHKGPTYDFHGKVDELELPSFDDCHYSKLDLPHSLVCRDN